MSSLTPAELVRYSRHLLLPEIGVAGQERLRAARVLVIGAGGLGSPAALYLAAAGVGTLGVADFDRVAIHNLQRQLLHDDHSVGELKTTSALARLALVNPFVALRAHGEITAANVDALCADYDLVLDGSDNFPTRYLVNDAAVGAGKPLVYASVYQFAGQVSVFAPHLGGPCQRCLFPTPPPPGAVANCGEVGVLGALCGVIGSWAALEALKLLGGFGQPLLGRLLTYDALDATTRILRLPRDPACRACGSGRVTPPMPSPTSSPQPQPPATLAATSPRGHDRPTPAALLLPTMTPSNQPDAAQPAAYPPAVSVAEAHRLQQASPAQVHILDVREPYELDICRLPAATAVPMREVPQALDRLSREQHLLVLCHHGGRSQRVTDYLRAQGYSRVSNITGGIDAWALEVDPTLRRY